MNFRSIAYCIGWVLALFSLFMLPPALAALLNDEISLAWAFAFSALLTGFAGGACALSTRGAAVDFGKKECFFLVALLWFILSFFASLPLLTAGVGDVSTIIFEVVSGLTTTGATALENLDQAPTSLLLWRALLQWLGGFITVVMVFVLLSYLGVGGLEIFQNTISSGEGASLPKRAGATARNLMPVYVLLTAFCAGALWFAGMPLFDAVCHAFSTISTGGFSTRDAGIAAFPGLGIEPILAIFMIIGAVNFSLHGSLLLGHWRRYFYNRECRYFLILAVSVLVIVMAWSWLTDRQDFMLSLRHAPFAIISLLSTTGYSSAPAEFWSGFSPILVIALILIGGSTGSTAGGLKLMRLSILFKQAARELARLPHPHAVVSMRFGRRRIGDSAIWSVWAFFFVFIISIAALAIALAASGVPPMDAMAGAICALTNTGPALAMILGEGASYHDLGSTTKLLLAFGMIAGRVEILALLTLFNPTYWRK